MDMVTKADRRKRQRQKAAFDLFQILLRDRQRANEDRLVSFRWPPKRLWMRVFHTERPDIPGLYPPDKNGMYAPINPDKMEAWLRINGSTLMESWNAAKTLVAIYA